MSELTVSVVLPAYNERDGIVELMLEIQRVCRDADLTAELIVVDDASPDGTGKMVASTFRDSPGVKLFSREGACDLGSAVLYGLERSAGETIVVMDSDGNHDPGVIARMVRLLDRCDLVVGSRYVAGGGTDTSRTRFVLSYLFNIFVRLTLWLSTNDNLSGYFAFRRSMLDRKPPVSLIFRGYGDYSIRFLYWAKCERMVVLEIPVVYRVRKGGASKTRFVQCFAFYLAAVLRLRLFGLG